MRVYSFVCLYLSQGAAGRDGEVGLKGDQVTRCLLTDMASFEGCAVAARHFMQVLVHTSFRLVQYL